MSNPLAETFIHTIDSDIETAIHNIDAINAFHFS